MALNDIEKACMEICDDSINMYVPWYIMAAYAYYVEDEPILEDKTFDLLSRRIVDKWNEIDHRHKTYLDLDMLKAGTYIGDYPPQIKGALREIRDVYRQR